MSDITKDRISKIDGYMVGENNHRYGTTLTEEHKEKMMQGYYSWIENNPQVGEANGMFGKNHTEETRNKMRNSHRTRVMVSCVYCNREFNTQSFYQYHGDNCLSKPGNGHIKEQRSVAMTKSQQTKDRLSESAKCRPRVCCNYCEKETDVSSRFRHHGEKCKMKQ
jgi:hypothetical protein